MLRRPNVDLIIWILPCVTVGGRNNLIMEWKLRIDLIQPRLLYRIPCCMLFHHMAVQLYTACCTLYPKVVFLVSQLAVYIVKTSYAFGTLVYFFNIWLIMRLTTRLCSSFQALVTRGVGNANVEKLSISDLPKECLYKQTKGQCDMLVEVEYSTLNYKDALVVSGR